ncbi:hypothetical protein ACFL0X_00240 [Nanoarchaeota archaeon]
MECGVYRTKDGKVESYEKVRDFLCGILYSIPLSRTHHYRGCTIRQYSGRNPAIFRVYSDVVDQKEAISKLEEETGVKLEGGIHWRGKRSLIEDWVVISELNREGNYGENKG